MIDLAALVARVRGMLVTPEQTLAEHVRPVPPWRVVAREHALPLIVASAIASGLLLVLFAPGTAPFRPAATLFALAVAIGINFGALLLMAAVVSVLAGMFGGRQDFNAAFTLLALSMTPAYLAEAVTPVPALGLLAFLAGIVYAFRLFYRGLPIALDVPDEHRGKLLILTILAMILFSLTAGALLGGVLMGMR